MSKLASALSMSADDGPATKSANESLAVSKLTSADSWAATSAT